jgi:hypothetical protein
MCVCVCVCVCVYRYLYSYMYRCTACTYMYTCFTRDAALYM